MVDFGSRLRELRIARGWTQAQLSARLGVTKSVVRAYETALRYPSYDILIRIAAIFSVSSDYLLGIEAAQTMDITGLSAEHVRLVRQLVAALRACNPACPIRSKKSPASAGVSHMSANVRI